MEENYIPAAKIIQSPDLHYYKKIKLCTLAY